MRRLPGQPTERAARVGGNTQAHRRRGVRDVVAELEQEPISRSWQPDAMTSRWRPWPDPGLRVFRLVQHEWEETWMACNLWAAHLATEDGSIHHVHAVSRLPVVPYSLRQIPSA